MSDLPKYIVYSQFGRAQILRRIDGPIRVHYADYLVANDTGAAHMVMDKLNAAEKVEQEEISDG